MEFRDLDDLYSIKDITIWDIKDYFMEKYGDAVQILWDCQDWGILKSIFCRKKSGMVMKDNPVTGNIMVTLYDKQRSTIEKVERELYKNANSNEKLKVYQLLNGLKIDGLVRIHIEKDDITLDCFRDYDVPKDSLIYKIRHMNNCPKTEWETEEGVEMVSFSFNKEDFIAALELLK